MSNIYPPLRTSAQILAASIARIDDDFKTSGLISCGEPRSPPIIIYCTVRLELYLLAFP